MVGVDGSQGSERALAWAAAEARHRGARLRVVFAWEPSAQLVAGAGWIPPDEQRVEELGNAARARLDEVLSRHGAVLARIEVEPEAVRGAASSVLLQAAAEAALLVVGTRGHGGFAGLLLGSVSQQCSHHAPCPVVIVPAGR